MAVTVTHNSTYYVFGYGKIGISAAKVADESRYYIILCELEVAGRVGEATDVNGDELTQLPGSDVTVLVFYEKEHAENVARALGKKSNDYEVPFNIVQRVPTDEDIPRFYELMRNWTGDFEWKEKK